MDDQKDSGLAPEDETEAGSSNIARIKRQGITRRAFLKGTALTTAAVLLGCGSSSSGGSGSVQNATSTNFAVLSDPHLYDSETLGSGTPEFDAYLAQDNKMLVQSVDTLSVAINNLKSMSLDFVIIPGDLTKDGELVNHQLMAATLADLQASGKKVYVIPGNHDINNPAALSYMASPPTPVTQVSPTDFANIYGSFGYNSALYRDTASLSYIAEPVPGLWLFAIDSCEYSNNVSLGYPVTGGTLSSTTLSWILAGLSNAQQQGKKVIGMMHHGILEHFTGQSVIFPAFVLTNWQTVSQTLSNAGLNIMFTGHFHANDITLKNFASSTLYDIETGSLVTAPVPYRTVNYNISNMTMTISSSTVTTMPYFPGNFVTYSQSFLQTGLTGLTTNMLSAAPYSMTGSLLSEAVSLVVPAMMAHYAGDEEPSATTLATVASLMSSSNATTASFGQSLGSLWTDLPTADNNVVLTLASNTKYCTLAGSCTTAGL